MIGSTSSWMKLKVGVVVLIGLIIFFATVIYVGTEESLFTSTYQLKLFVPNIQGLTKGSMVALGGLKVGSVQDLTFARREGRNGVDISLKIEEKYRSSITANSHAIIRTIGLLGDKFVDISIGDDGDTPLQSGEYLTLVQTFDLEMAMPRLDSVLTDFVQVMADARRITGSITKGEGTVGKLVMDSSTANGIDNFASSMSRIANAVEQRKGFMGRAIYDTDLSSSFEELVTNLKVVSDSLRQGKGSLGKLIMEEKLYHQLRSISGRADSLLGRASSDTTTVGQLVNDRQLYDKLSALINDLSSLISDFKAHPDKYVKVSIF